MGEVLKGRRVGLSLGERLRGLLPFVEKPGRYIDGELNSIRKAHSSVDITVALAFPDVYEIGQSYLGFRILYHVINRMEDALAERVFAPWPDLETLMRSNGIPLLSLESGTPLSDFDIVGFTLQYELTYTNVLNMLDLSGIPLLSRDRKVGFPLVIAGGPCGFNPEPLADYIDAIVLGDGEEITGEMVDLLRGWKGSDSSRDDLLRKLSGLSGVYVPSLHVSRYADGRFSGTFPAEGEVPERIERNVLKELALKDYPLTPIVPIIEVVHSHLPIEVMRGCTRGCRFCSAGMTSRPVRERPPQDVVSAALGGIACTGCDELSLLSLSTSDYIPIRSLVGHLGPKLTEMNVALSLPSLRPDSFSIEIARLVGSLRKSGLTFAPEAGSQRLRNVINKSLSEKEFLETGEMAYSEGWNLIKLYFMVGLPTESAEDIEAIIELVRKVSNMGKKVGGKRRINVSISPFSPKPNTPFQWEAQEPPESLSEKGSYLKRSMSTKHVNVVWRNTYVTTLETVLARGDRRVGRAIFSAWSEGAKFDGWTEFFDFSVWEKAFDGAGIDWCAEIARRDVDSPLPWNHLFAGVEKDFLLRERDKAYRGELTPDCRSGECTLCGACSGEILLRTGKREDLISENMVKPEQAFGRRRKKVISVQQVNPAARIAYSKGEELRFIGHLDLVRTFDRAFRIAGIPVAYSQGYHPHPKIAFGPPLPLGIAGLREYIDVKFSRAYNGNISLALNRALPEGIRVLETKAVFDRIESLSSSVSLADYELTLDIPDIERKIEEFLRLPEVKVLRRKGEKKSHVDVKSSIEGVLFEDGTPGKLRFRLRLKENLARPVEVISLIVGCSEKEALALGIVRTTLWAEREGKLFDPMDIV